MLCSKCGRKIPDDALMCPYCGTRIESAPEEETASVPKAAEQPSAGGAGEEKGRKDKRKKKDKQPKVKKPFYKRWWFIVLAVIAVLLIVIIAVPTGSDASKGVKEAKAMSEKDFIASCKTYDYKALKRSPDEYTDKALKTDVRVEQVVEDGYYRVYAGDPGDKPDNWYDDEFIVEDARENSKPLVEGDVVTIYGVYLGTEELERVIGGTDKVPSIAAIYTTDSENIAKIKALKKSINFTKASEEYGWKTYRAVVKNPIDAEFDSFSLDVSLKKGGTVVETQYASVEHWKAGEKATFEFETDANFDKIVIKGLDYFSE